MTPRLTGADLLAAVPGLDAVGAELDVHDFPKWRTAYGRRITTRSSTTSPRLGYNTIRIPFSNQMVETPIVPARTCRSAVRTGQPINADLKGLNALQDLQKIVTASAGQAGLKVILDDHRSEAGESAEQDGLWYTSTYTSQDWVNDWTTLAGRCSRATRR